MNRSKQIAKKGIKLNAFINIEYCYICYGLILASLAFSRENNRNEEEVEEEEEEGKQSK